MELLQLRYFIMSAETENFSYVAKKYGVPPSAVSSSVKKLERELDIKLFDRSANRIRLNGNGMKFAESISRAIDIIDGEIARISDAGKGIGGDINLLVRTERSLVTDKMIEFRKERASVNFHLTHDYGVEDISAYDIIIDEETERYRGFIRKKLIEERIRVAASASSMLAGKRLGLSALSEVPFITMSKNSSLCRITEDVCRKHGFDPNIVIESDDPYYVRKYIAEDFGIAFFPETSWQRDKGDGIVFLDVADFDYMRTTFAYLNVMNSNKVAEAFFEHLA